MAAATAMIQPATIGYRRPTTTAPYARASQPVAARGPGGRTTATSTGNGAESGSGCVTTAPTTANRVAQTRAAGRQTGRQVDRAR